MGTKDAKFYTDSKSKGKTEKKRMPKSYSQKTAFLSIFEITFYLCTISQFHLQIWNKHIILRFVVLILTYMRKKSFGLYVEKNILC